MKNSKILLMALFVVTFIIGLCFCTQVKAAEISYFNLKEEDRNWDAFSQAWTPDGNIFIVTKDANMIPEIISSGKTVEDMTPFKLTTDKENVAKIDAKTGKITILSEGEFSVLADGKVEAKVRVISAEDMKKFNDTNDKVNKLVDDIEIENEDKTAGLIYCSPFEEGCMMCTSSLQLTDMFGKNFAESFPNVTYKVMDDTLVSIDAKGKITANENKTGDTEIFIDFGNNVYRSFNMTVVYGWDGYLTWRSDNGFPKIGESGTPSTTNPEQNPTEENQPQASKPAEDNELDDEPKAGINTSVEFFVSGLAIISLAVAVIAKKH